MWSLLAVWVYVLLFPAVGVAVALAGGASPKVARFGFGPHRSLGERWGVDWQLGCVPAGAYVSFGEDLAAPLWLGPLAHGVMGVPVALLALVHSPGHLAGAARILGSWMTFRQSPSGGPLGTLAFLWSREPADPLGYVFATLTVLCGLNVFVSLAQGLGMRLPRLAVGLLLMQGSWAAWALWLDLSSWWA